MDRGDKIFLTVLFSSSILFLAFLIYLSDIQDEKVAADRIRCEAKNGVYLDRTFRSGKSTSHLYTCINKDIVIEDY